MWQAQASVQGILDLPKLRNTPSETISLVKLVAPLKALLMIRAKISVTCVAPSLHGPPNIVARASRRRIKTEEIRKKMTPWEEQTIHDAYGRCTPGGHQPRKNA